MKVLYEDNHIIIVYKESGEIVQGDKTGDKPLSETVKEWIKAKYNKPGNVYLGVVHRLDRPVAGLVVFGKTSKATARLSKMFRDGDIHKTYWAIIEGCPAEPSATLTHWILRNEAKNKSFAYSHEVPNSKKAVLSYEVIACGERYSLLKVNLKTGRHHQIRCQLSAIGCPIRGDLKYGAKRSNHDGSISLLNHEIDFIHPVSHKEINVVSPLPADKLWQELYQLSTGKT